MADSFEEIKFSWGVVAEIVFFIAGIMVIYFTQKGRIDRLENQFDAYFEQNDKDKTATDLEIESIKADVKKNYDNLYDKLDNLKDIIHKNHIATIEAINKRK